MDLSPAELKFVLRLLGYPGYRTAIAQLRSSPQNTAADRICRRLGELGLVDYTSEIVRFAIAPAGRMLLGLGTTSLPVTPSELWILRSCQSGAIRPEEIHRKVSSLERLALVRNLDQRGLVKIKKIDIKEAWLTAAGQQFLRQDWQPHGSASSISGDLLSSYLRFLRQFMGQLNGGPETAQQDDPKGEVKPTAATVLQTIQQLDRTLASENGLPIFHLRDALQPPLTRAELDEQLYQLQREDRIELSPLQAISAYGQAQIAAGIPQAIAGPLFFISVI
ncbi:hypothetical protein IQ241_08210 [Romeria aff. gracilis LEGE 07310]|uniref:Uncharacterized protein n=1 Tax=Vasconcelosia minhoensis LEGE 07310 TaxID=915328 RepID=A0A8J7AGT0_9CYAN|nr:hypothetical protein [Romeria gracilis]MBE9077278.1 hypothetical protein [Romeria aff. gracilis LEGE 07310]